ncbi:MAG: hypothetical protein BGO95_01665 [Micrococcales bacterium 73-13]|nr:MAG: hypothetical protein BGO95_01665 [Micrococcales bacterium 73-13]
MTWRAIDRLQAEIEEFADRVTARILVEVPEYSADATARTLLGPSVQQNADEVLHVLRGEPAAMAAARNVGLASAIGTSLPLDAVLRAYQVARDAFVGRLRELGDGEDLGEPLGRLESAYREAVASISEEYLAAKRRLGG